MEVGDNIASGHEQGSTAFYSGDGDGLGFCQVVSAGCQKASNRSGGGNAGQRFRIRRVAHPLATRREPRKP